MGRFFSEHSLKSARLGFVDMANQTALITDIADNNTAISGAEHLEFEEKVADLDSQINELRRLSSIKGIDYSAEIRQLQREQVAELKRIYSNLTAWQTVQVARHPNRPILTDYLNLMVKDFCELHGDRCFGDDRAIITGLGADWQRESPGCRSKQRQKHKGKNCL